MTTDNLLIERNKTHGDWKAQAECAASLKLVIAAHDKNLPSYKREALDMIATKMSRILCGNAHFEDHWDDIAGYAQLGKSLVGARCRHSNAAPRKASARRTSYSNRQN